MMQWIGIVGCSLFLLQSSMWGGESRSVALFCERQELCAEMLAIDAPFITFPRQQVWAAHLLTIFENSKCMQSLPEELLYYIGSFLVKPLSFKGRSIFLPDLMYDALPHYLWRSRVTMHHNPAFSHNESMGDRLRLEMPPAEEIARGERAMYEITGYPDHGDPITIPVRRSLLQAPIRYSLEHPYSVELGWEDEIGIELSFAPERVTGDGVGALREIVDNVATNLAPVSLLTIDFGSLTSIQFETELVSPFKKWKEEEILHRIEGVLKSYRMLTTCSNYCSSIIYSASNSGIRTARHYDVNIPYSMEKYVRLINLGGIAYIAYKLGVGFKLALAALWSTVFVDMRRKALLEKLNHLYAERDGWNDYFRQDDPSEFEDAVKASYVHLPADSIVAYVNKWKKSNRIPPFEQRFMHREIENPTVYDR